RDLARVVPALFGRARDAVSQRPGAVVTLGAFEVGEGAQRRLGIARVQQSSGDVTEVAIADDVRASHDVAPGRGRGADESAWPPLVLETAQHGDRREHQRPTVSCHLDEVAVGTGLRSPGAPQTLADRRGAP